MATNFDDPYQDDEFDFKKMYSKLDAPDTKTPSDPSDTITNADKPVYTPKGKKYHFSNDTKSLSDIGNIIKREFAKGKSRGVKTTRIAEANKSAAIKNIAPAIARDKAISRTWEPKVKKLLPRDIYSKKAPRSIPRSNKSLDQTDQLVHVLTQQKNISIDQFIRSKTSDMINQSMTQANHASNLSVLNRILDTTKRNHQFIEGPLRKYLMTSIDLKFRHIFLTKDLVKHTKGLISTLSLKLDSIKHNTALSEVNKISAFGELKRTIRIRGNTFLADTLLGTIKEPVGNFIKEVMENAKKKVSSKLGKSYNSPIEFDQEDETNTKIGKLASALKKTNKSQSFQAPDLTTVYGNSTKLKQGKNFLSALKPSGTSAGISGFEKRSTDTVDFNLLTRRSITDIIPGFLSRIHQQSTSIAQMLNFTMRQKMPKEQQRAFDKAATAHALVFDRITEDFSQPDVAKANMYNKLFGSKASRTEEIKPLIDQMRSSFKEHGGEDREFVNSLPNIITFVTNIAKHAKIVKLDSIKRYLNGEELSEFETKYLDAALVDVPKREYKPLLEVLGTTFFKDQGKGDVDKDAALNIGESLRTLSAKRSKVLPDLIRLAADGGARNNDFINNKGLVDHSAIRAMQSDVDIDSLLGKAGLPPIRNKSESKFKIPKELQDQVKEKLKSVGSSYEAIQNSVSEGAKVLKTIIAERISDIHSPIHSSKKYNSVEQSTEASTESKTVSTLADIKKTLVDQFSMSNAFDNTKIQIANQMLMALSRQGGDKVTNTDIDNQLPIWAQVVKMPFTLGSKLGKLGGKGLSMYLKGMGRFYSGLFKMITGLVSRNKSKGGSLLKGAMAFGKAGGGLLGTLLSGYAGMYGTGLKLLGKGAMKAGKFLLSSKPKNPYIDVYRKNEVDITRPLIQGKLIKEGRYIFSDGSPVESSYSIKQPVLDAETRQIVISQDDIDHGLVDNNNKRIVKRSIVGKLIGGAFNLGVKGVKGYAKFLGSIAGTAAHVARNGLGFRKGKKGKGEGLEDSDIKTLITNHLITITDMMKPITAYYSQKNMREGSYEDYRRDRSEEAGAAKKKRARDLKTEKDNAASDKKKRTKSGVLGAVAALFGGGDDDKESSGPMSSIINYLGGGYLLGKAKGLFGKKVAGEVAKGAVKKGLLRSTFGFLARSAISQGIRTGVISVASALATAASSPAILAGLAVGGIAGGGTILYNWKRGKDRRKSITEYRSVIYRVPRDKLNVLVKFEDSLDKAMRSKVGTSVRTDAMRKFIKDFGFNPDDPDEFEFFKYWYASVFFPIFQASRDLFKTNYNVDFDDQDDLTDTQLNEYYAALKESSICKELDDISVELSRDGFKYWEHNGKKAGDNYGNIGKANINERKDMISELTMAPSHRPSMNISLNHKAMAMEAGSTYSTLTGKRINTYHSISPAPSHGPAFSGKSSSKNAGPGRSFQESMKASGSNYKTPLVQTKSKRKGKGGWSVSWKSVQDKIVDQLVGLGWTEEQAIGITANIKKESSGNESAVGDSGLAYGIAQWHPDRQRNFQAWAGKPIQGSSLAEQVAFMDYEMRWGEEKNAGDKLKKATNAQEAAGIVSKFYERPRAREREASERGDIAATIAGNRAETVDSRKAEEIAGASTTEGKPGENTNSAPVMSETASAPSAGSTTSASVPPPSTEVAVGSAPVISPSPGASSTTVASGSVDTDKVKGQVNSALDYQLNRILQEGRQKAGVSTTQPAPAASSITRSATPVAPTAGVTVVDPESKTQTGLLSEQNQLLSRIVALLGNTNSGDKSKDDKNKAELDDTRILAKLDGVIASIGQAVSGGAQQTNTTTGTASSQRTVERTTNSGIDVGRVSMASDVG